MPWRPSNGAPNASPSATPSRAPRAAAFRSGPPTIRPYVGRGSMARKPFRARSPVAAGGLGIGGGPRRPGADRRGIDRVERAQPDRRVFTGKCGTPIDPRTLNRRFTARCDQAGVRHMTVHDARRTCATLLAALEVHPRVIMRIRRHADVLMTLEIYANARADGDKRSAPQAEGAHSMRRSNLVFVAVLGRF
ncbi:MAG TPA: tyrosine-type recombinase/integrase, partial [Dermatophilaceae bacterium]